MVKVVLSNANRSWIEEVVNKSKYFPRSSRWKALRKFGIQVSLRNIIRFLLSKLLLMQKLFSRIFTENFPKVINDSVLWNNKLINRQKVCLWTSILLLLLGRYPHFPLGIRSEWKIHVKSWNETSSTAKNL